MPEFVELLYHTMALAKSFLRHCEWGASVLSLLSPAATQRSLSCNMTACSKQSAFAQPASLLVHVKLR